MPYFPDYFGKLHRRLYKTQYYASRAYLSLLPHKWIARSVAEIEAEYRRLPENEQRQISQRVDYYNKLNQIHTISGNLGFVGSFKNPQASAYFYDIAQYLRYFPENTPFAYEFGDVTHIPPQPAFVKSRPIAGDNQNSVVLKLDSVRHFYTLPDRLTWQEKKPLLVWRGAAHQPQRLAFLERFHDNALCDVKCIHKKSQGKPYHGEFMSIANQLHYQFILSIEGNDVATNLKWIMASQSLAFMTRPKYETWLMEGLLQADVHFVHLQDDYADLEEKLLFYQKNPQAAQKIVANANQWMSQFFNKKQELITSVLVMKKYFNHIQAA
ncbi:MAG: lipopolysaccharide A protein [Neisseriaceae bacterium]|nr:lipopolysaccharide A protein [Neisseriaceae bacterium]